MLSKISEKFPDSAILGSQRVICVLLRVFEGENTVESRILEISEKFLAHVFFPKSAGKISRMQKTTRAKLPWFALWFCYCTPCRFDGHPGPGPENSRNHHISLIFRDFLRIFPKITKLHHTRISRVFKSFLKMKIFCTIEFSIFSYFDRNFCRNFDLIQISRKTARRKPRIAKSGNFREISEKISIKI